MYVMLIGRMIDAARQDSVMTVSLFQRCLGVSLRFRHHFMDTDFNDIFMMCIYSNIRWVLCFITVHNAQRMRYTVCMETTSLSRLFVFLPLLQYVLCSRGHDLCLHIHKQLVLP